MKNNKFAKISLLVLSLALVLGAAFAIGTNAAGGETQPLIISQNVAYEDNFALIYAVDAEGITGSVTLNVYEEYPGENTEPAWSGTVETPVYEGGNLNKDVYKFTTPGIAAKDICKQFYIQAVANDNTANKTSEVIRYSLAEYLYERLATTPVLDETTQTYNPSDDQKELYNNVIAFGDSAQKVVGKISDAAQRVNNYRFVTVEGGKLDTYFTTGVYPIGTALSLTANEDGIPSWSVTKYTGDTAEVVDENAASVSVAEGNYERLHVKFSTSTVMHYQPGTLDLDTIAYGTVYDRTLLDGKMGSITKQSSYDMNNISFVDGGAGHGTVMYAKNLTGSCANLAGATLTGKTAKNVPNATAYEVSFDLKMELSGNSDDYLRVKFYSELGVYELRLVGYSGGSARTDFRIYDGKKGENFDVDPTGWINLKFVVYKEDADNLYIYINEENVLKTSVKSSNETVGDNAWGGTTADTNGVFRLMGNSTADAYYMDNIFNGYTYGTVAAPFNTEAPVTEPGE